jgi:hypothetical protein
MICITGGTATGYCSDEPVRTTGMSPLTGQPEKSTLSRN